MFFLFPTSPNPLTASFTENIARRDRACVFHPHSPPSRARLRARSREAVGQLPKKKSSCSNRKEKGKKKTLLRRRETAAGREALEQERDAFEQEAARFTALGMQTQQRSEEAARAKEAAMQERLAAEAQQRETEALKRQLEVGGGLRGGWAWRGNGGGASSPARATLFSVVMC